MRSLRTQLLLIFGIAILISTAVQFAVSFQAASSEANKLFDYHMQRMATVLSENRLDTIDDPLMRLGENINYDFVIQLWDADQARTFQARPFRIVPQKGTPGFSNVTLDNGDWRVYTATINHRVVQVAQKLEARQERAIELAIRSSWPVFPVSILLFLTAWWGIGAVVSPIDRLGTELARRTADELNPVSADNVPREVGRLVSALNSLLERVALAMQSQRRFVADAAHELRSPLTALKLQMHTLSRARNEPAREQAIGRLTGGVERASRLVEQLLALARHDPMSPPPERTRVNLNQAIDLAANDVAAYAASRNVRLDLANTVRVDITGNAEDLRVMMRNLIDNATRYSHEGSVVRIAVGKSATNALISIEDSGPGIPAEDRERVFDRFFRVPGSTVTGSGLGLAIVKAIVERHKGAITLADARGGGLQVQLLFPRAPESDVVGSSIAVQDVSAA